VPRVLQPKMKEFLTANGRGWGVAAAEVIKKGAYIVEYAGAPLIAMSFCWPALWYRHLCQQHAIFMTTGRASS